MSLLHRSTVARILSGATTARRILPRDIEALAARWVARFPQKPFPIGIYWEWDISGSCQKPVMVAMYGTEYRDRGPEHLRGRAKHVVFCETKCRQCPNCLKKTQAHWRLRARAECEGPYRTWYGTLTFRPEVVAHYLLIAQNKRYIRKTVVDRQVGIEFQDYEDLPAERRTALLANLAGQEVTKYFKRLRKAGCELKYLAVPEAHLSGNPHFHCLVHEKGEPIRHALLTAQWNAGFSNWKLARDANAVGYVTKYLTKASLGRVRASERYGKV